MGRATIPAEHAAEWRRLSDEAHAAQLAGNKFPQAKRVRLLVLQGLTAGEAEALASVPETAECRDTRAI